MVERPVTTPETHPQRFFPRAHKSALGLAFGLVSGVGVFALTALHVLTRTRASGLPLYLLANFFAGYTVTWPGAFIGLAWGFAVGFIGGWLLGFVHNFTVGLWLFVIRTRQDLRQTKNFLDHI